LMGHLQAFSAPNNCFRREHRHLLQVRSQRTLVARPV
jgi:hypothetical protein